MITKTKIMDIIKSVMPEIKEEEAKAITFKIVRALNQEARLEAIEEDLPFLKANAHYWSNTTDYDWVSTYRKFSVNEYGTSWVPPTMEIMEEYQHWLDNGCRNDEELQFQEKQWQDIKDLKNNYPSDFKGFWITDLFSLYEKFSQSLGTKWLTPVDVPKFKSWLKEFDAIGEKKRKN